MESNDCPENVCEKSQEHKDVTKRDALPSCNESRFKRVGYRTAKLECPSK